MEKEEMEQKERKLVELETAAVLSGVKVNTKEICDKWILLTYDMPHTEAGDKARYNFLKMARKLGACQHTESVYLLPYSAAAGEACLELSKAGKLFIWTSESTNAAMAEAVTKAYDEDLGILLKKLSRRVDRMIELRIENNFGILNRMRERTEEMIKDMGEAVQRRGSLQLEIIYTAIVKRYEYT
ncbi:MAG: hypothetical protein PHC43_00345 [Candidatus Marinimicrobia bacterium]|nr:hypothetical protein [Candidatus Neomarinimicrobiota bacterium]